MASAQLALLLSVQTGCVSFAFARAFGGTQHVGCRSSHGHQKRVSLQMMRLSINGWLIRSSKIPVLPVFAGLIIMKRGSTPGVACNDPPQ